MHVSSNTQCTGYCDCCKCKRDHGEFRKLLEFKDGIVIYQHTPNEVYNESQTIRNKQSAAPADSNNVIIIHKTTDFKEISADYSWDFDINKVRCPRCRHMMVRAKGLLEGASVAKLKGISGVCNHCKLKQLTRIPCHICQNVIKKFEALKLNEDTKNIISSFLDNAKRFLRSKTTIDRQNTLRAYSDIDFRNILKQKKQYDQRPSLVMQSASRHIQEKQKSSQAQYSDTTLRYLNDISRKVTIKSSKKSYGANERYKQGDSDILSKEYKKRETIEEMKKIQKFSSKLTIDSADEIFPLKSTIRPAAEAKPGPQIARRSTDVKNISDTRDETVLGIGTTGIIRKSKSEGYMLTSLTDMTKHSKDTNFEFYFPKIITKKEKTPEKTSAQLIKDTQVRFQAEHEKKRKHQAELRKVKMQKKQEKYLAHKNMIKTAIADAKLKKYRAQQLGVVLSDEFDSDENISYDIDIKTGKLIKRKTKTVALKGKIGSTKRKPLEDPSHGVKHSKDKSIRKTEKSKIEIDRTSKQEKKSVTGKDNNIKRVGKEKREMSVKEISKRMRKQKGETNEEGEGDRIQKQKVVRMEKSKDAISKKEKMALKVQKRSQENVTEKRKLFKHKRNMNNMMTMTDIQKEDHTETLQPQEKDKEFEKTRDAVEKKNSEKYRTRKNNKDVENEEVSAGKDNRDIEKEEIRSGKKKLKSSERERNTRSSSSLATEYSSELFESGKMTKHEIDLLNKVLTQQEKTKQNNLKLKTKQQTEFKKLEKKVDQKVKKTLDTGPSVAFIDIRKKKEPIKQEKDLKQPYDRSIQKIPRVKDEVTFDKKIKLVNNDVKDDLIMKLIHIKRSEKPATKVVPIVKGTCVIRPMRRKPTVYDLNSKIELETESLSVELVTEEPEIIFGTKICLKKDVPIESQMEVKPTLFQTVLKKGQVEKKQEVHEIKTEAKATVPSDSVQGVFRYALSDRAYIDNGWTLLPTEKIVRKINVYRMHPVKPEFDWFKNNKNKKHMQYDSGEKLAEIDDNGRGRWYYKNGNLALDYYDSEDHNAQQRYVIYSSGEPDNRGRSRPVTVLGMFDYLGNGVIFDDRGKIRLKYNQTEGVILDRKIGPASHWKWNSLNDPPELHQVMIDTQMNFKDPEILAINTDDEIKSRLDDEQMLAVELKNFVKDTHQSYAKSCKSYQIRMKAFKINDQFSIRILDQKSIHLYFKEGSVKLKLNLGLQIDHSDIIDTSSAELGDVPLPMDKMPADTESVTNLQKTILKMQGISRVRKDRNNWKKPDMPAASVEKLTEGVSKPLRPPLLPADTNSGFNYKCRIPSANNLYYNTRII